MSQCKLEAIRMYDEPLRRFRIPGRCPKAVEPKDVGDWQTFLAKRNQLMVTSCDRMETLMRLYEKPTRTLQDEYISTCSPETEELLANPDQPRAFKMRGQRLGWKSVYGTRHARRK